MASRDKKDLNSILVDAYEKASDEFKKEHPNDPQPFITCTNRSDAEQSSLYAQPIDGIDNNGNGIIDDKSEKVTQAKAGQSPHNYKPSAAFDIAFINVKQKLDWNPELFKKFADIIVKINPMVEAGINWQFKDAPHFQLKDWRKFVK